MTLYTDNGRDKVHCVLAATTEAQRRFNMCNFFATMVNAGLFTKTDSLLQKPPDFHNHISIGRCLLHGSRLAPHMHQADRNAELGSRLQSAFGAQCIYIVDHRRARPDCRSHDCRLAGIH